MSLRDDYVLAAIFARGGSKGVPRKNIRVLDGKPLIAYAIHTAQASSLIDRVIISTDDPEIAEVAQNCGGEIPFMRPPELAQDDSPEWEAWQHAIQMLHTGNRPRIGTFVCVPATSPFRAVEDVEACIRLLQKSDADVVITVKPAERNPYFNMVVMDDDDNAEIVISSAKPIHHRQTAPKIYDITTVAYVTRPDFILNNKSIFDGKVKAVLVPTERALDIDTEFDFKLAEFLMTQNS